MPMGPLELYKRLPQTNCGDCGQPACLAFATQVVGYGQYPGSCPHLERGQLEAISTILAAQRQQGAFVKRKNHQITREHLQEKIRHHDFQSIASGLGAVYDVEGGAATLRVSYFDRTVIVSGTRIRTTDSEELDPWDRVLLYNYVYFSGSQALSNRWVGLESFPNSIPKRAALEDGCHRRISQACAGSVPALEHACLLLGGVREIDGHNADLAFRFQALPRVPLLLLFWDEDREEGFEAQAKVLFDASAMDYLDLEGLCFLAEKLAERLITCLRKEQPNV